VAVERGKIAVRHRAKEKQRMSLQKNTADGAGVKPRVCMLLFKFYPVVGGAERQCHLLAKELVRNGYEVCIVTQRLQSTPRVEWIDGIKILRCLSVDSVRRFFESRSEHARTMSGWWHRFANQVTNLLVWTVPNLVFYLSAYVALFRMRDRIDIVHVHEATLISYVAVLFSVRNNKKVVVKEAGSWGLRALKEKRPKVFAKVAQADAIIALSKMLHRDIFELGIAPQRIVEIPNGVELPPAFSGIQRPTDKVLFVGNLSQGPMKGLDVLLRSWKDVVAQIPNAELDIVGGGSSAAMEELSQSLQIYSSIRFRGYETNPGRYYRECSVFVLPSRNEGMSNALLEAMAHGCACVATNISGNQDLITHKTNGYLVGVDNPQELAGALITLLKHKNERDRLGHNARRTISHSYQIDVVSHQYMKLYQSLVEN
jgi:glycosyltransferase involved in cell wall biosynthesis